MQVIVAHCFFMIVFRDDWFVLLVAFIFLVLAAIGQVMIPLYTGKIIDYVAIDNKRDGIMPLLQNPPSNTKTADFRMALILLTVFSAGSALASGVRGACFTVAGARYF